MIDYLVRVTNLAAAKTAMANWLAKDDQGADVFRLPQWCDLLPVDAYSSLGTPAAYEADGVTVKTSGTPPTLATGKWFIVSLDRGVKVPAPAQGAIRAQAPREDGLTLPAGVAGLSTIWAGMKVSA